MEERKEKKGPLDVEIGNHSCTRQNDR